jgi:hypothetical protein
MTYDLRRLRLHGLIKRVPKTHRYQLTDLGLRTALFFTHSYNRIIRTGLAEILDPTHPGPLRKAFTTLQTEMDRHATRANAA